MRGPPATSGGDADGPQQGRPALLLVNLGTPDAPTPRAVRRYLAEFLHDHRVVSLTRWLWCPLLHFVILPLRSGPVARKYAAIWTDAGSPLAANTRALAQAVQRRLPEWRVLDAMRYGRPSMDAAFQALRRERAPRVLVLPLYPQYSTSTTASVADALARVRDVPVRMLQDYHADAGWVAAVAAAVRAHWQANGLGEHLLFSFHGLPQRLVDAGDPYAAQCEASARLVARELGLGDADWSLSYQSRFGREQWLQPATSERLDALAAEGVRTVDVACPGFAVDCLETLEEVAMMLAGQFAARGGQLRYIPCLNDADAHADALAAIARREAAAWDAA